MRNQIFRLFILLGCLFCLAGCHSLSLHKTTRAPVMSKNKKTAGHYVVVKGDTLYSIATRHGWDFQELAEFNHIPYPYPLQPGDAIQFGAPHTQKKTAVEIKKKKPETHQQARAKKPVGGVKPNKPFPVFKAGWQWPVQGPVIQFFNPNGRYKNLGIDIAGEKGNPVLATLPGEVVYSGNGLRGYGHLVIIKHDSNFLSAYAHNDKVFVNEGDRIKVGQKIAEMGNSGVNQVKLHFEIRYQGKPVDPLNYLPNKAIKK